VAALRHRRAEHQPIALKRTAIRGASPAHRVPPVHDVLTGGRVEPEHAVAAKCHLTAAPLFVLLDHGESVDNPLIGHRSNGGASLRIPRRWMKRFLARPFTDEAPKLLVYVTWFWHIHSCARLNEKEKTTTSARATKRGLRNHEFKSAVGVLAPDSRRRLCNLEPAPRA
jgi:hypothetical protein